MGGILVTLAPIFGKLIDRLIPDKAEADRAKAELEQSLADADARATEAAAQVVTAEVNAGGLARSWRPILMYLLMFVIIWYLVPVPLLAVFAGVKVDDFVGLDLVPSSVWTLLTVGMGGYIGGRSAEKVAEIIMKKKR